VINPRVLIVDDMVEVRNLLERVLSKDYTTSTVSSGAEALKLAKNKDFKIAFLASRVLRKEGWVLLDSLKAIRPQARIILIADYPGDPFLTQLKDKGLYASIHKPFTINAVLELAKDASV
jgi:DNA-binding NtrC family response regulator